MLTIPFILALIRLTLAEASSPYGFDAGLLTAGYVVNGFLTVCYLTASPFWILLVEQQAQSLLTG
jgi:hypothetical protein